MKKLILTLAHLLILTSLIAQQNAIWSLPPNYAKFTPLGVVVDPLPTPQYDWDGITPNQPNFPSDGYDGQISEYSHNAMQNKDGDLLFFIIDGVIYDKDGHYISIMNQSSNQPLTKNKEVPNDKDIVVSVINQ